MEIYLEIINNHFEEVASFVLVFIGLIGFKMILSSVKMPQKYFDNKNTERMVIKKIIRTNQLDNIEKEQKLRDLFDGVRKR